MAAQQERDYLSQVAQATEQQSADVATAAEDRRALTEALLGSGAQVAGTLGGVSAEVLPFTRRYTYDPQLLSSSLSRLPSMPKKKSGISSITDMLNPSNMFSMENLKNPLTWLAGPAAAGISSSAMDSLKGLFGGGGGGAGGAQVPGLEGSSLLSAGTQQSIRDLFTGDLSKINFWGNKSQGLQGARDWIDKVNQNANLILGEAQALAEQGNFAGAQKLKEQADALIAVGMSRGEFKGFEQGKSALFNMYEDPTTRVRSQLGSPSAQAVGALVQRGRALTDRDSEEYKRTLAELQDPIKEGQRASERAIAAGMRGAENYAKRAGAAYGAAKSVRAEENTYASIQRQAALDRANIISESAQQLSDVSNYLSTQFAPQFATNAAGLARSWAAGEAGTRDEFTSALTNLNASIANFSGQLSQMYHDQAMTQMQIKAAQSAANKQLVGSIVGSVVGAAGSAAGALCHGAAEYFGWYTPDWYAARSWIVDGWKGFIADAFRAFYRRSSPQLAWAIRNVPGMKALWKPFFNWARVNGGAR